jgi:hypothetical protein
MFGCAGNEQEGMLMCLISFMHLRTSYSQKNVL